MVHMGLDRTCRFCRSGWTCTWCRCNVDGCGCGVGLLDLPETHGMPYIRLYILLYSLYMLYIPIPFTNKDFYNFEYTFILTELWCIMLIVLTSCTPAPTTNFIFTFCYSSTCSYTELLVSHILVCPILVCSFFINVSQEVLPCAFIWPTISLPLYSLSHNLPSLTLYSCFTLYITYPPITIFSPLPVFHPYSCSSTLPLPSYLILFSSTIHSILFICIFLFWNNYNWCQNNLTLSPSLCFLSSSPFASLLLILAVHFWFLASISALAYSFLNLQSAAPSHFSFYAHKFIDAGCCNLQKVDAYYLNNLIKSNKHKEWRRMYSKGSKNSKKIQLKMT